MVQTTKVGSDKTGTSSITYTDIVQNCGYRLPCGYCMMLDKPCPMGWSRYDITCTTYEKSDTHVY